MRAKGIDVSKYQQSFEPVGNIDFIIQRASCGLTKDEKYNDLLPAVKQIERRGAYHYFSTELDPIEQAEFFYRAQAGQGFKWLAVDYEKKNNVLNRQGANNLEDFYDHLCDLTDKPILVYTGAYIYRDNLIAYNIDWDNALFWISRYQGTVDGQMPNNPDMTIDDDPFRTVDDWTFWQWEADGNEKGAEYGVGSEDVCLDVFNGTVAELDAWLGTEEEDCCEELKERLSTCDAGIMNNFEITQANANKIELNGIDLDGQAGEIERLFEEAKELKLGAYAGIEANQNAIGSLRAREIAHTREHNEAIGGLWEMGNNSDIYLNKLDNDIKDLRQVCQILSDEVASLEERMSLEEMITDNNYMACNELIEELQEEIDDITIPITNHTHWYQRFWLWLVKENK